MKSDFKEGRCGVAFKNGKLYQFTKRHVLVMTTWPDPRAWFKRRSHGWKATRKWADSLLSGSIFPQPHDNNLSVDALLIPDLQNPAQLALPGIATSKEEAKELWWQKMLQREKLVLNAYADTIPEDIRAQLVQYNDRKWHLFNLLTRCPGALDLSCSNPALLYALASNWVFHKPAATQPIRAARRLVNKRQKLILDWLGFPATETARQIMAKIMPSALSVSALLCLRRAFDQPDLIKTLAHLDSVNAGTLKLLRIRKLHPYLTPRFIEDVSRDNRPNHEQRPDVVSLLLDTIKMAEEDQWRHCPPRFFSIARLQEVHDDLTRRMNRQRWIERRSFVERRYGTQFPPPPFPGTDTIRPIDTPEALHFEGGELNHCVGSHIESVFEGQEYVYQVLAPVRATLSIRRHGNGWSPSELSMKSNKKVDKPLETQIYTALFSSGKGLLSSEGEDDLPEWVTEDFPPNEDGPVIARCDLDLQEDQRAPVSWNYLNPKQLPLLTPEESAVYRNCLMILGSK